MNISISSFILDRSEEITSISVHGASFVAKRNLGTSFRNKRRTTSYKVYKNHRLQNAVRRIEPIKKQFLKLKRVVVSQKHLPRFLRRATKTFHHSISNDGNYLSTHLWHAKRFQMTKDCKIYKALVHRSRGFKSSQWASRKHSVIQDISFHQVLVIHCKDDIQAIISEIQLHLLEPREHFLSCNSIVQEVESLFFKYDKFPSDCIGKVLFCVAPKEYSTILIWVSPVIVRQILCELQVLISKFENSTLNASHIHLSTSKFELNRFSMKGPLSTAALKTLMAAHNPVDLAADDPALAFFNNATRSQNLSTIWKAGSVLSVTIPDPRKLNRCIFSNENLIRSDAVHSSSKSGFKNEKESNEKQKIFWPECPASSPLWNVLQQPQHSKDFRLDNFVNNEKRSIATMSWIAHFQDDPSKVVTERLAQESLEKPFQRTFEGDHAKCPALLVRTEQNLSKRLRKGCAKQSILTGWDLIIPSEWGATIWRALQQPGIISSSDLKSSRVYAVGEEEMQDICRLHGSVSFPKDFPYTDAGRQYWATRYIAETEVNTKRPPGKRKDSVESMDKILTSAIAWNNTELLVSEHSHVSENESPSEANHIGIHDLVVVRGESYLRDFLPPEVTSDLRKTIEHYSDLSYRNEEFLRPVDLLASGALTLPNRVFLQVRLVSIKGSRGLPLDMAKLISPFDSDYISYASSCRELRENRAYNKRKAEDSERDNSRPCSSHHRHWAGVHLKNPATSDGDGREYFDSRPVIGVVTSGYKPHTNKQDGCRGEFSYAIGLCNAAALNHMFCSSFARYRDELDTAHYLALYCNPRSGWLRPCLLQIS